MPAWDCISLLLTSALFALIQTSFVETLPTAVELGGAVVAAVEEEEAAAQRASSANAQQQQQQWDFGNLTNTHDFTDIVELQNIATALERIDSNSIDEGRGKKHKKHKMLKQLYPLLITAVLAKTVLIPLILKVLTAISTGSFIMAKIALAASGLMALKWVFASSGKERNHIEIVHVPTKSYGGGGLGYNTIDWGDLSWSGSNYVDVKTTPKQHLKYIPLKGGGGSSGGSSSSSSNLLQGAYSSNKAHGASSGYKYHFDTDFDGKPFL